MRPIACLLLLSACSGGAAPTTDGGHEWPPLPECSYSFGSDPPMPQPVELLTGSSGTNSYRLWRCATGPGIGISNHYRGDAFELVIDGTPYRTTGDTITYTSTLHNWADTAEAIHPSATLRWRTMWDGATTLTYLLEATATDGTVLLPETQMR